jgi:hypothetical protein
VERVAALIPAVEVPHDKNLSGIGCPDSEMSAGCSLVVDHMSAQFIVELKMAALVKKVEILIGQETCGFVVPHRSQLLSFFSFPSDESAEIAKAKTRPVRSLFESDLQKF